MTATTTHRAREVWRYETHHRSKPVLATITPEGQIPTVAQLDQFHTGGILATAELASRGLLREALPCRWLEF
jgi:hypothetical protein